MITVAELVKRVLFLINENEPETSYSLFAGNASSFDELIMELLPQAIAAVQSMKSTSKRVNTRNMDVAASVVADNGNGTGLLVLPEEYVSLLAIQLTGWDRPCSIMHAADSLEASLQGNEYTRAGCSKPVCVDSIAHDGRRALMLSPFPAGSSLKYFVYEARFDTEHGLDGYDEDMATAVTYMCAALLYRVFEKYEASNSFMAMATGLCNGTTGFEKKV